MEINAIVVLIIFIVTYIFIFSEKVPRTTAAFAGALIVMAYGINRGFLTEKESVDFIKFDVIFLLMSMMIMVNILLETGFFGYVALKLAKFSKGNVGLLLILLGIGTAFLSMAVDNVTTIIILIPVTIEIAKKIEVNPVPLLLAEAVLSNMGGVATMVGDPPNIIIASYSGFSFDEFIYHLLPPVLIAGFITTLFVRRLYLHMSGESKKRYDCVKDLDPESEIEDPVTMKKTLIILTAVFILFMFHGPLQVSPSFVALAGAAATLLVNYYDPERVLKNVEWSVLLFFASLFILVGALDAVGILKDFAEWTVDVSGDNEMVTVIMVLWLTALLTSFVDNIPLTTAMAPVILHMGDMGLNTAPMWWALALGVGFGGNATPIGSSAGVVTVGIADKYDYHISMKDWAEIGIPSTLISLIIATLFIVVFWGFYS